MLPFEMIAGGNFTLTSVSEPVDIELQAQNPPDYIWIRNRTAWGDTAQPTQVVQLEWHNGMAQGSSQNTSQTTATGALVAAVVAADGISTYDTANPPIFTPLALTAITGIAGTFVVSMANTGTIAVGDYVRLTNTTGELQIAGYTFQVTAVTTNVSITLGYMASSGITFAADATAGFAQKFIPSRFYPRYRFIANITQAAQAVVFFTERNDFTPGEIVSFRVSSDFGMDEINNRQARVLTVTNSATVSSITIDLDTSGFTAFTFPTSAVAAAGVSPAVCLPSSSGVVPFNGNANIPQQPPGTNLLDAFDNRNVRVIHIGATQFANATIGDVYDWYAMKFSQFNGN